MNTFKKYPKSWLTLLTVLFLAIVAVMGWHWTDTAKTRFWWTFWEIAAVVSGLALLAGWILLKAKDKE